jgi:hypothetical protein
VSPTLRRHGTTIALVALAAIATVVVFWTDRDTITTDEARARRRKLVPVLRPETLSEIAIDTGTRRARLVRGAEDDAGQRRWEIEADSAREPAEEMAVDQLIGSLREGVMEREIAPANIDRRAMGLDSPRGSIALTMGTMKLRVLLGGPAPTPPGAIYAEVEGHHGAVITADLAAAIGVSPDALRERALVRWEAADLDSLAIEGEGGSTRLVRATWPVPRGASFRVEGAGRASGAALDRVWDALAKLKADAFLSDAEADKALARKVRVTLAPRGGKRVTIDLGGDCPGHTDDLVAVRREEGGARVNACVAKGALAPLVAPAAEMVDRKLVGARADEVIDLKLEEGKKRIVIARSGAHWHEQEPVDRTVEPDVGRAFLERVLDVRGARFVTGEPGALGLDPPRAVVRVASVVGEGQKERLEQIEIGAEQGGFVHVRRVEDGAILAVPAEAAAALAPDELALRPKRVLDEPASSFQVIKVVGPRGTQRAERRADGAWRLVDPKGEGLVPDPGLLSELAEDVASLAADRWIGVAKPEHGLDRPRITVEVETAGGKKIEVLIGSPAKSGSFAQVRGDAAVFVAPQRLEAAADRWLVDRAALLPDVERVRKVTILGEGGKKVVLEQSGGALTIAGAPNDAAASARAAAVRDALGELIAEGAASVGPPEKAQGFDKPSLVVTVEEEGKKPVEIRFGASDTFRRTAVVYARRAGIDATYAIAQGKVRALADALR